MSSNPDVSTDRRLLRIPSGVTIGASQVVGETNENPPADNSYTVGTASLRWASMSAQAYLSYLAAGDAQSAAAFGIRPGGLPGLSLGAGGASAADISLVRTAASTLAPTAALDGTINLGASANRFGIMSAISHYAWKAAGDAFPVMQVGWDNLNGKPAIQMGAGGASAPDIYVGRFVANALSPIGDQITSLGDSLRSFKDVYASKIANNGIAVQAGSTTATTDGSGQITITFPQAFSAAPTAVTATVNGANYVVRIVSKSATTVVLKILSPSANTTTGSALTSVTDTNSGSFKVITSSSGLWAAASSGGATTTQFEAIGLGAIVTITPVTGHTSTSGTVVTSVSASFANVTSTSVTVDWIAVA